MIPPRLQAAWRTLRAFRPSIPLSVARQAAVALAVLVAGWSWGVYSRPDASQLIDLREVDGVAVRGGVLDLSAMVDQERACVVQLRRWLWRINPRDPESLEWVYLYGVPFRPPLVSGRDRYLLHIPIPAWVEAGDWHYLGETENHCSLLDRLFRTVRKSPDVLVRIVNPTLAMPAEVVAPPGAVTIVPTDSKPIGAP